MCEWVHWKEECLIQHETCILYRNTHSYTYTHVLLGVLKVGEEGVLAPLNALVDVSSGIREPSCLSGVAAEKPV